MKNKIIAIALLVALSMVAVLPAYAAVSKEEIMAYAKEQALLYDLSPELVWAVINTESSFKTDAKNGSCIGLMQINSKNTAPWIAKELGMKNYRLTNYKDNIRIGCYLLDSLRDAAIEEGWTDSDALFVMLIRYNRGTAGGNKWMKNHDMYSNGYAKVIAAKYAFEQSA